LTGAVRINRVRAAPARRLRRSEEDIRGEHFLTDPENHRKIVDALYRAAASGGWVDLGDTPR
jgi:hypothetical protein